MSLGLVTMFLPRMELDFLGDWIAYHRAIGFSRFFLYDNGHVSIDPVFGKGKTDQVWHKKPEANYHLELSDEEVDRRLAEVLGSFGEAVEYRKWIPGTGHGNNFRTCQMSAVHHALARQQKAKDVDWLGHLDIDELLVCGRPSLVEMLGRLDLNVHSVRIRQKLFESRWRDGKSKRYSELSKSFGIQRFNPKLLVRVSTSSGWRGPHSLRNCPGKTWYPSPNLLRFHHFRGTGHFGSSPPKHWGIQKYLRRRLAVIQMDDSHSEFCVRAATPSDQ